MLKFTHCQGNWFCSGCRPNRNDYSRMIIHNKDVIMDDSVYLDQRPNCYYEIVSCNNDSLIHTDGSEVPAHHCIRIEQTLDWDYANKLPGVYKYFGCSFAVYQINNGTRKLLCCRGLPNHKNGWFVKIR